MTESSRCCRALAGLALVLAAWAPSAPAQGTAGRVAQDTARGGRPRSLVPDSLRAPVSPGRAFLMSLAMPGLGQSRLRRPLPGAIYSTVEALSFVMLLKAQNDLRLARARVNDGIVNHWQVNPTTGAPVTDQDGAFVPADSVANAFNAERVASRRGQVEDWIAVLIANHLFAGADAFVASLLWDLPARVGLQRLPSGYGLGLSVRW